MEGDPISAVTWPMLIDATELTQIVAESCGVDISVAQIALENSGFDAETAIDMLTHATLLAPKVLSKVIHGKSQDDAVSIVCESTGCDIPAARAALAAQDQDLEAAVDLICNGGLCHDYINKSRSSNANISATVENSALKQVFTLIARVRFIFDSGEKL